jgi:heme A synthase
MLAFNLLVILWGAYVRATGSGAGCGSHWPLCNGALLPDTTHQATFIEFAHRISSGAALLGVVLLVVWSRRLYPRGAAIRRAGGIALVFMITEALLGAGLVVFELVAENVSIARAVWMALHLVNTFFLLAPLTLCAWWAARGQPDQIRPTTGSMLLTGTALAGTLLLGMSGAVAALGDTLFPAASLAEALRQDMSPTAHILIRLRMFHPAIAAVLGIYLLGAAWFIHRRATYPVTRRLAVLVALLFGIEAGVGLLNVALLAPVAVQLVHLLLATLLWISLVLLTTETLTHYSPHAAPLPSTEPVQAWSLRQN